MLQSSLDSEKLTQEKVCLVNMPYADIAIPSLALGLLKSSLEQEGIGVKVLYANMLFAEMINVSKYYTFSTGIIGTDSLYWKWSFSVAAFPEMERNDKKYFELLHQILMKEGYTEEVLNGLLRDCITVREAANVFIEKTAKDIVSSGAKIVGCTSTLRQHVPSLALLRKIKELDESIVTIMGGANCVGSMGKETHRSFRWVDYVMSGEGEENLPYLCKMILQGKNAIGMDALPTGVLGPCHRKLYETKDFDEIEMGYAIVENIDNVPVPDFSDYFKILQKSSIKKHIQPGIVLQTSRGCWWNKCNFCGLNGPDKNYRVKTPDRALEEIRQLETKYENNKIQFIDNILDMNYFGSVLEKLSHDGKNRNLFYATKANLSKEQIKQLRKSGMGWIQPGVESLHTELLKLMNKGVEAWQNIQLLKWCRQYGIRVIWNILWRFPGESDDWYKEMVSYLPLLEHFEPPSAVVEIAYHRFSSYCNLPEKYGLELIPNPALAFIFPLEQERIKNLAYSFYDKKLYSIQQENNDSLPDGIQKVKEIIGKWQERYAKTFYMLRIQPEIVLHMKDDGENLTVLDTRTCAVKEKFWLSNAERSIILRCDTAVRKDLLLQELEKNTTKHYSEGEISQAIENLKDLKVILEIDGRILSLINSDEYGNLPTIDELPYGTINPEKE